MQDDSINTRIQRSFELLKNGKINRRTFIMSALAAGTSLSLATGLADQAHAATPKKGGRFRAALGFGSTTDSLDPATHENGFMVTLSHTISNCLTEIDPNNQVAAELAESYESSPDAAVWTFNLRKGIEFHNGKTLTADDVIASFNYHRGENSKSAAKGMLSSIDDIRKLDRYTVQFALTGGNADFPVMCSDYHLGIFPSRNGQIQWSRGHGTGPYAVIKFEPGVRAILAKNKNYWKEGRAHFDQIELLSILDTAARQSAIINDEVDMANRIDPKTVHLVERVPNLNILEETGTLHYTFPMRVNAAPFDNYDLRMAIKLGVRRQELLDKILFGHGQVGNDHPISTANRFHASDLPQREFDPDRARYHLRKSGMRGQSVDLSTSEAAFVGATDAAVLIKNSLDEVGLNVNVVREPSDGYWSNVWNKKGWSACYWGGRPTEDWMFTSAYVADSEWNDTAWRTGEAADRFNRIVTQARSETNERIRADLYAEAQRLIHDDGGALIPMFASHIHALNKRVRHDAKISGNWENDGGRAAERWWFA